MRASSSLLLLYAHAPCIALLGCGRAAAEIGSLRCPCIVCSGGYTRKIFVEQELQVLKDLELELERRAANVPAYVSVEE